jgi:hypothetical protein
MKVIVEMEIETVDYCGKAFKKEIEKLVADIDKTSRLTKFTMRTNDGWNGLKDYKWEEIERA